MEISHVLRGDDHISNTPRQIQLYAALGAPPPRFGHLPMILGPDGARLSKRHGAVSVTAFRDDGILPAAMVNFLALLGWAFDGEREMFTLDEWKQFLIRSVGMEPQKLNSRAQDLLILRMVPFVERNYNLVELGPRGTGKSHLFQQISPYAHLISGFDRLHVDGIVVQFA